jgi:phage portal protein BeeE
MAAKRAKRAAIRKARISPVETADRNAGASTQPEDEPSFWFTPEGALPPPEDLDRLASLTQFSRTRRSCIAAIVQNTVGLGYTLEAIPGREQEVSENTVRDAIEAIESMSRRDEKLHRPNFKRQISSVKWDEQECGNGYLEVSRNRVTGQIDGLYHVVGKRVRRNAERDGWLVGARGAPSAETVRYYDFGTKVEYDGDGKPKPKLAGNGKRWNVNELIPFQLFTSESRDYGLPPDAALAWDYLGDYRAAKSNAGFFDGSATPPTILFVKGASEGAQDDEGAIEVEVDPRTAVAIADTLRADSDVQRRVALVPLPDGVDIEQVQLALRADRDVGFVEFRKDNRRATLGAFRLSPIFVADIEDTNYSTAEVERAVTKEQVFDPEQERTADILTATLLKDLGLANLRFKFASISVGVEASADALADRGAVQYGELRQAHGFPRLAEADEGAEPEGEQVPNGWNAQLVPSKGGGSPTPPGTPAPEDQGTPVPGEETGAVNPDEVNIEDLAKQADGALFAESVEDALHRVAQMVGPDFALRPVLVEKGDGEIVVKPYRNGDGAE